MVTNRLIKKFFHHKTPRLLVLQNNIKMYVHVIFIIIQKMLLHLNYQTGNVQRFLKRFLYLSLKKDRRTYSMVLNHFYFAKRSIAERILPCMVKLNFSIKSSGDSFIPCFIQCTTREHKDKV